MRSLKEILRNVNLIRLSGNKDFILVELNGSVVKIIHLKLAEPFYQLENKEIFHSLEVISNRILNFGSDYSIITKEVENFLTEGGIKEPVLLVGISDFKFTSISIPSHIESDDGGEELWFSENSSKFLPDGSNLSSFSFSYEKIKEDDDYKAYSLIVARKDYIDKISGLFNKHKIAGIFPYIISVSSLQNNNKENYLCIDLTSNKIQYSFYDESTNLFSGELFTNLFPDQSDIEERQLNEEELQNSITDMNHFLSSSFPDMISKELDCFVCCQKQELPVIEKHLKKTFNIKSINELFPGFDPFFTTSLIALNKFINQYDSHLNLLEDSEKENSRDHLEKQASLRVVLGLGILLMALLFFSYLSNFFLSSQSSANEEIVLQSESSAKEIEHLEKENQFLKKNLSLLIKLKDSGSSYSGLLKELSEIIDVNCRFTELTITENNPNEIGIIINGLSRSQGDVAGLIKTMERNKKYNNISLVSISSENTGRRNKDYLEFKLSAEYNLDNSSTIN